MNEKKIKREKPLKIINPDLTEEYHIHSLNYSDGMNTVDEIVQYAGKIGLKKIMITDHADYKKKKPLSFREQTWFWKNVHNDVEVSFGVEADLLNRKGDIADIIGTGRDDEPIILSLHLKQYEDDYSTLAEGFVNAIKRYHERIFCLGHLHIKFPNFYSKLVLPDDFDIELVIKTANEYGIPLEINGNYLKEEDCVCSRVDIILEQADTIVISSDAHNLAALKDNPQRVKELLEKKGIL